MKDFIRKYIKVIHLNLERDRYYKISYGFVKDSILLTDMEKAMLLTGNFCSKHIDENGKFQEGGRFDNIIYVNKQYDCYREVDKEEYEQFKNDLIKEATDYEQNNTKK